VKAYDNTGHVFCKFSYGGGWNFLNVPWDDDPYWPPTGDYATAFSLARSDWVATATPVLMPFSDGSSHVLGAVPLGMSGPYGHTSEACAIVTGVRVATTVDLNTDVLGSYSSTVKRSTAGHELGHHIGIRHSTVSPALLNSDRNREVIYTPQPDDVCGVNHRYPSNWSYGCSW
jgi:hypothetical protein